MRTRTELVCVGGGLAGLVAGLRAAELGVRTIVFERGADASYPCNSRICYGIIHAAYRDLKLPPSELEAAMRNVMSEHANEELISAVAANAGRMIDWLRQHGGKFIRNPLRQWAMAPVKPLTTGLVWRGMGPDFILRTLAMALSRHGGELRYGARVNRLLLDADGSCSGVVVSLGSQTIEIEADAVVIADGGYQANVQLLGKHISPKPAQLFARHAGSGHGDGLNMALAAGAAGVGLDCFYGHLLSVDAFGRDDLWPYPQVDAIASAGILVDRKGQRRLDEGKGGIYLANGMAKSDDLGTAVVICDNAIWNGAGRQHQIPPNPLLERHGASLFRASSIGELAHRCGLPPAELSATVESYNNAVRNGSCGTLSPPRSVIIKPQLIVQAPFMAIPVCAGITNTMGGIAIDGCARVLTGAGKPIGGLYAAGAAVGGLDGGPDAAYIGGLVKAVFGLLAAENAASRIAAEVT